MLSSTKKYLHKIVLVLCTCQWTLELCIKEEYIAPTEVRKKQTNKQNLDYETSITGKYVHVKIQQK